MFSHRIAAVLAPFPLSAFAKELSTLSFSAPLSTNILMTKGAGLPVFSRASSGTIVDHEGVVRLCKTGETRMVGMRRVENLFSLGSQNYLSTAAWSRGGAMTIVASAVPAPDGTMSACELSTNGTNLYQAFPVVSGRDYIVGTFFKKFTSSFCGMETSAPAATMWTFNFDTLATTGGGNYIAFPNGWYFVWKKITAASTGTVNVFLYGGASFGTSGTSTIGGSMAQDVTGQAVQIPGEYVPTGTGGPNFGSELVANGTNLTNTTGWVSNTGVWNSTLSTNSGNLRLTMTGTTGGWSSADYSISGLIVGASYTLNGRFVGQSGWTSWSLTNIGIISGTVTNIAVSNSLAVPGKFNSTTFVATATSLIVRARVEGTPNGSASYADFAEMSVTPALFSGANVDGVKYFDTRLDGRPIYEAYGPELVSNGEFTNGTTGWSPSGSTIAVVNGELELTNTTTSNPQAYITVPVIVGRTYRVMVTLRRGTADLCQILVNNNGSFPSMGSTTSTSNIKIVNTFVAASSTVGIIALLGASTTGKTGYFDNFSVQEVKPLNGFGLELAPSTGDASGWTAVTAAVSSDGNLLKIQATTPGLGARVAQKLMSGLKIGSTYKTSVQTYPLFGTGNWNGLPTLNIRSADSVSSIANTVATVTGGIITYTFVATETSHIVRLRWDGDATVDTTAYTLFGALTIREVTAPAGYLNEPQRTNLLTNTDISGAVVGVVAGGTVTGALPTGWAVSSSATGVVVSVAAKGSENGMNYVDIAFSGTPSAGGNNQINFGSYAGTSGVTYNHSVWVKRISGSAAAELITSAGSSGWGTSAIATTTDLRRYDKSNTVTATGNVFPCYATQFTNGVACNFTVRLYLPQAEVGSSASSNIPTTTASAVRAADSLSFPVSATVGPVNLALSSYALSNATYWSQMIGVVTTDNAVVGPTGAINATLITHTNQFSNIRTSNTFVVDTYTIYFWARRNSGANTLYFYSNSGVALGSFVPTSSWTLYAIPITTVANEAISIFQDRATSGRTDVEVYGVGISRGTYTVAQIQASGGIPLTTTAPNANSQGTIAFTLSTSGPDSASTYPAFCIAGANSGDVVGAYVSPNLATLNILVRSNGVSALDSATILNPTPNTQYKIAISWNNGRIAYSVNGATPTVFTGRTMPLSLSTVKSNVDHYWFGTVNNPQVYPIALSDSTLKTITT